MRYSVGRSYIPKPPGLKEKDKDMTYLEKVGKGLG